MDVSSLAGKSYNRPTLALALALALARLTRIKKLTSECGDAH